MHNSTQVIGNLGNDPELKELESGHKVCNFSLATKRVYYVGDSQNRTKKEETTWYRVAIWGAQAEACKKYLTKGKQVFVEGRVSARAYTNKEGKVQASLELTANTVQFLGQATHQGEGAKPAHQDPANALNESSAGAPGLEEIPFMRFDYA